MTRYHPGDWLKINGKWRLVIAQGKRSLCLKKGGRSWTDPNPRAWHDKTLLLRVRGRRAGTPWSRSVARRVASWRVPPRELVRRHRALGIRSAPELLAEAAR